MRLDASFTPTISVSAPANTAPSSTFYSSVSVFQFLRGLPLIAMTFMVVSFPVRLCSAAGCLPVFSTIYTRMCAKSNREQEKKRNALFRYTKRPIVPKLCQCDRLARHFDTVRRAVTCRETADSGETILQTTARRIVFENRKNLASCMLKQKAKLEQNIKPFSQKG